MAKLLQPNNSGATPRRVTLKTTTPAPKATLRLKGADGKAIEPKKTPKPAAPKESFVLVFFLVEVFFCAEICVHFCLGLVLILTA